MFKLPVEIMRNVRAQVLKLPVKDVCKDWVIRAVKFEYLASTHFIHGAYRSFLHSKFPTISSVNSGLYTLSTGSITITNLYIRRTLIKGAYVK